jgi:tRNA1Val (adenine37-N6)-methyltransferase
MNSSDDTLDALFDGRLTLVQSRSGYRFSVDALLLAYFVTVKPEQRIVDLGTGNGVLALVLAHLHPSVTLTGVELQSAMTDRAERNVELNGLRDRIKILRADVRQIADRMSAADFDVAVCNPPYRQPSSGRISVNAERQAARHETHGDLHDFLRAAAHLLRQKGRVALCYSALRLTDLLTAMRQVRIEPKRLRIVHSFRRSEASLVLVEGVKEGRAGLTVAPPLILYRQGKSYSDEVAAMIAGLPK